MYPGLLFCSGAVFDAIAYWSEGVITLSASPAISKWQVVKPAQNSAKRIVAK